MLTDSGCTSHSFEIKIRSGVFGQDAGVKDDHHLWLQNSSNPPCLLDAKKSEPSLR